MNLNLLFVLFRHNSDKIQKNITKLYPDTFQIINYQNYKSKLHILLYMEEIEVSN